MTRAEILTVPAGWQLDALVAEHILGQSGSAVSDFADSELRMCRDMFSLHWDDARTVAEWLRERGLCLQLTYGQIAVAQIHYGAVHLRAEDKGGNLAAAICRVALLAVEALREQGRNKP